nr:MAG TPA: hypothetical protein [Caudoviricetes sp.]
MKLKSEKLLPLIKLYLDGVVEIISRLLIKLHITVLLIPLTNNQRYD